MKQRDTYLIQTYRKLYGAADHSEEIKKIQRETKKKYILLLLLFLCILSMSMHSEKKVRQELVTDEQGTVISMHRPAADVSPFHADLQAKIKTPQGLIEKEFQVRIEPYDQKGKKKEADHDADMQTVQPYAVQLEQEIARLLSRLNEDPSQKTVVFPTELENGETIQWAIRENTNLPLYLVLFLFCLFLVHRTKYDKVKAEEKAAKASIIRELPEFTNKLILLLNAGVVLNTAFVRIMEDRGKLQEEKSYFYQQLGVIYKSMSSANSALQEEFRSFARRSGVRELIRVSNVIHDNVEKGTDLTEKLQRENEVLWFARKQQAEEQAKLAETKLTMPLMILLSVLVLVTIAPAMMDM